MKRVLALLLITFSTITLAAPEPANRIIWNMETTALSTMISYNAGSKRTMINFSNKGMIVAWRSNGTPIGKLQNLGLSVNIYIPDSFENKVIVENLKNCALMAASSKNVHVGTTAIGAFSFSVVVPSELSVLVDENGVGLETWKNKIINLPADTALLNSFSCTF